MDHNIDTLIILAEVTIAFVAFAAIVASLRVTLGEQLSPFQQLLVHFFTEVGLLAVSVMLLPLVLAGFWQDELAIARITVIYAIVASSTYLVHYIRRRIKIKARTPFHSLVVMIGYGVWIPVLAVTAIGSYWPPSLAIVALYGYWALFSCALIFTAFLASFVQAQGVRV